MADYISRDYTVENMENYPWDTEHDKNAAVHLVRELVPAADVRPVVRASWEDATGYIYIQLAQRVHCPVCKSYAYFHAIMPRNYCPNCGADMGEGSK